LYADIQYPVASTSIGCMPSVRYAKEFVALSSVIFSNPVKVASWLMRKFPMPTRACHHALSLAVPVGDRVHGDLARAEMNADPHADAETAAC
jgi:hypothetical protein